MSDYQKIHKPQGYLVVTWFGSCQQQRQEEQELLRKRRAQMQRRGDSVEKDEQAFAQSLGRMVEDCWMQWGFPAMQALTVELKGTSICNNGTMPR